VKFLSSLQMRFWVEEFLFVSVSSLFKSLYTSVYFLIANSAVTCKKRCKVLTFSILRAVLSAMN